jgi:hypothetical protein
MRNNGGAPLDVAEHKAIADALDGKKLTAAIHEAFDAQDYFDSVPKPTIEDAVREAMGDDHAKSIARMDKATAAKFAATHLPKTKWLPKQLRVTGYNGPAAKRRR